MKNELTLKKNLYLHIINNRYSQGTIRQKDEDDIKQMTHECIR